MDLTEMDKGDVISADPEAWTNVQPEGGDEVPVEEQTEPDDVIGDGTAQDDD